MFPKVNSALWTSIGDVISSDAFVNRSAVVMGDACCILFTGLIRGETYDDMGPVGEDPRWNAHAKFHDYLLGTFPQIHSTLKYETVNTYGLIYTWEGSDKTLKPLLMMGHMDTVPVNLDTLDTWTHPPWSGHFDGTRVWGRGSVDDKSGLVGTMMAIELLLEHGFKPPRTVVLAFGFDEEAGGPQGAGHIAPVLISRYGENSFAAIIDEGGGFSESYGSTFATPGVAEKGSMNVWLEIAAPGGHSSIPPSHTSIGMLASAIVKLENAPFPLSFERSSTVYADYQCYAQHAVDMDASLRATIKASTYSPRAFEALAKIASASPLMSSLISTTQAVDMVNGGVKSNALPEQAWAIINHRIHPFSSSKAVQQRDALLLYEIAQKHNLTYSAFDFDFPSTGPGIGTMKLSVPMVLEPAPVSPTEGPGSTAYQVLSGSIRSAFNTHRSLGETDDGIFVAPGMPTGNTDTKYFWKLTPNVFRYSHRNSGSSNNPLGGGVHTVNECLEIDNFVEMVRFYYTYILNMQEATGF
ncbi:hypothetical protein ONZ45_g8890 [Pleurotus djamor]|nr:hypothetical protein ONZ45_g8890 [Pleurotus djamor]